MQMINKGSVKWGSSEGTVPHRQLASSLYGVVILFHHVIEVECQNTPREPRTHGCILRIFADHTCVYRFDYGTLVYDLGEPITT